MKGLVLEGGAMRGMFTAGVLDVMMENNIEFDGIAGVSAGAAFGSNFKSRQIGRTIRYNVKYCRDWHYCSFRSLIFTGDMFGADFCYRKLPEELDLFDIDAFNENPAKFYVVCTDIETGEAVYHEMSDAIYADCKWYKASASLPIVAKIVEIEGKKFLDGGLVDSIPLKFMQDKGFDKNVVILTQPRDYIKNPESALPLIKRIYKKYPKLIDAVANRHVMYNDTLEYIKNEELKGNILVISPETDLGIGHVEHKAENLKRVYETGRRAGEKYLEKIKEFLSV